jgi:tetratricopeptide (TPR) repeat protein
MVWCADPDCEGAGPVQRAWYRRLEREHDNLRAALRWLLDRDDRDGPDRAAEGEAGLRLAGALGIFWLRRGYYAEAGRWLEAALARAPQGAAADPAVHARTLVAAGHALLVQGAGARARAVLEEGLALAERHGDPAAVADAHIYLGVGPVLAGEAEAGQRLLREALRRWEALGNPERLAEALFSLGLAAEATGDAAAAAARYADALGRAEAAGDKAAASDLVRSMAERAGGRITEVEGSHVIMLSQPQAVTDVILSAVRAVG